MYLNNVFYVSVLLGLQLGLSACGSLMHKKDEAQVSQVKKIAVVAFTGQAPAPAGLGLDLASGKLGATQGGSMIPQSNPYFDQMFADLGKSFEKNLNWSVVPTSVMLANPAYTSAYDRTMKGWQNKMGVGAGMKQFNVQDIMDFDGPRILDVSGRDQLIQSLGVDAIVVARVSVSLVGTTVMGIGSRKPLSTLSFMVYRKGISEPIWFEGSIKGEEQESVGKTHFFDESKMAELGLKSAQSAYKKIGSTVQ